MKKERHAPGFISILIAIVPFGGYFLAYAYETGFLEYYSLPTNLISLSLESIIRMALTLGASLSVIFIIIQIIYPIFDKLNRKNPIHRVVREYILHAIYFFPIIVLFSNKSPIDTFINYIACLIFLAFYVFGWTLLFHPWKMSYAQKLKLTHKAEDKNSNFGDFLMGSRLKYLFIFIITISLLSIYAKYSGITDAGKEKTYITFQKNNKNYAIIRSYGGNRLAVSYDTKNNLVKQDLIIIPNGNMITAQVKNVGPLITREKMLQNEPGFIRKSLLKLSERALGLIKQGFNQFKKRSNNENF